MFSGIPVDCCPFSDIPVDCCLFADNTVDCFLFPHKSVDVVLGPVVWGGHLEDVGDAEQCLSGVTISYTLETVIKCVILIE